MPPNKKTKKVTNNNTEKIKKNTKKIKNKTNNNTKKVNTDNILLYSNTIEKELNNKIKNYYVFSKQENSTKIKINIKNDIEDLINSYIYKFNKLSEIYQDAYKNVKQNIYNKFYIDEYYPPIVNIFIILLESNIISNLELLNTTNKTEILNLI